MNCKITKSEIITIKIDLTKLIYKAIFNTIIGVEVAHLLKDTLRMLENITPFTLDCQLMLLEGRLTGHIERHSKMICIRSLSTPERSIIWDCINQCKRLAAYVKSLLLVEQKAFTQRQKELDEKLKSVEEAAQRVSKKIEEGFMRIKPDTELIVELNSISNSCIRMTFVNIYTLLQNVERFLQRVTYANIPACDMIAQATSFIEQLSQVEEGDYLRFSNVIQRCIKELQKIKSISNEHQLRIDHITDLIRKEVLDGTE